MQKDMLEKIAGAAELSDAELELVNGRGGCTEGCEGGYGGKGGKGGFGLIQGGRSSNEIINNFSFRRNLNQGAIQVVLTVSDFSCNSFGNVAIGY